MFRNNLSRIWNEEKGEIIVEYGLIIALAAFILIGIILVLNNGGAI